jgi:hypothetical protein
MANTANTTRLGSIQRHLGRWKFMLGSLSRAREAALAELGCCPCKYLHPRTCRHYINYNIGILFILKPVAVINSL